MIPQTTGLLLQSLENTQIMPSYTYKIYNNRVAGFIDNKDAIQQTVDNILRTERFAHCIYSWNYGAEIANLYAIDPALTKARLYLRVEEALLADNRIKAIDEFTVTQEKGKFFVNFNLHTIFGDVEYEGDL